MYVLIIEDDSRIVESMKFDLTSEKIRYDHVNIGEHGADIAHLNEYDVILLDLRLPDIDGFEILRRIRSSKIKTPVIIISAIGQEDAKIRGLNSGADDYLVKPFANKELIARIRAVHRRSLGYSQSIAKFGKVSINLEMRRVEVEGKEVAVTPKEYTILEILVRHRGSVVKKNDLINHLYPNACAPDLKILDVFVCKLRSKLFKATGENYIETDWGRGYKIPDHYKVNKFSVPLPGDLDEEIAEEAGISSSSDSAAKIIRNSDEYFNYSSSAIKNTGHEDQSTSKKNDDNRYDNNDMSFSNIISDNFDYKNGYNESSNHENQSEAEDNLDLSDIIPSNKSEETV